MATQEGRFHLVPAFVSFLVPGLGQLLQHRPKWAAMWFAVAVLAWLVSPFFFFLSALIAHGAAAAEAGLYGPPPRQ